MEYILAALIGLCLASSCGFRVFIPPLIVSIAGYFDWLPVHESFTWMASMPAIVIFSVATLLEVAGHFIPVINQWLNIVASPIAVLAGTVVSAAAFADFPPYILWPMAVVAGGGIAGLSKGLTSTTRWTSSLTTAGLATPFISLFETLWALFMSVVSVFLPIVAAFGLILTGVVVWKFFLKRLIIKNE